MTTTKQLLQTQYTELFSYPADKRWSENTLREKVAARIEEKERAERQRKEAEAMQREIQWRREQTAKDRGTLAEFVADRGRAKSDGDKTLAWVAREYLNAKNLYEKSLAEFNKNATNYPVDALRWADDLFSKAAKVEVAQQFEMWFNEGMSYEELLNAVTRTALNKGRFLTKSTSRTANMIEQEVAVAWTKLADELHR